MLSRNVTRTIDNTVETTQTTEDISAGTIDFEQITADFFYVGFRDRFAARHFQLDVPNATSSVLTVEYWNGTAYTSVEDLVDETVGFTKSGFIHWQNKRDWEKVAQTPVSDKELFWIRISVSVNLDAGTTLQSVLNLFSDDNILRFYYPEIVADARYLPPGRSNFLEQHLASKNSVVLRLKQRGVIDNEGQIIDPNPVMAAAVHKTAEIILTPIEQDSEFIDRVRRAYADEINQLKLETAQNKDGLIDASERRAFTNVDVLRRG